MTHANEFQRNYWRSRQAWVERQQQMDFQLDALASQLWTRSAISARWSCSTTGGSVDRDRTELAAYAAAAES